MADFGRVLPRQPFNGQGGVDGYGRKWFYVFMRTTLDLPDDLLRRVKARAAMEGVKMKDLVTLYLQQGLAQTSLPGVAGRERSRLPTRTLADARISALTNAEVEEIFSAEDSERAAGG